MINGNISIKADTREQNPDVERFLSQEYGIAVVREQLRWGDYVIDDDIVVERKTPYDFAQSIIDGRLFRQAAGIKQGFDHALFIVEGEDIYAASQNIHQNAIAGALVSIALRWQIPVLFSRDARHTAFLLYLAAGQRLKANQDFLYRCGRRPKRLRRRQLFLLQGLPRVGPALAEKLLNHFGSVETVMTASEQVLKDVDGIGRKKAGEIKKVLTQKAGV